MKDQCSPQDDHSLLGDAAQPSAQHAPSLKQAVLVHRGMLGSALSLAAIVGCTSLILAQPPASSSSSGGAVASSAESSSSGGASGINKSTGPQKDSAKAAVDTAVTALTKEYAAFLKDPATTPLRAHADYFSTNPSTDITEDAVVAALTRSFTGNNLEDIYIKWQLLSAVPGHFSDKSTPVLINVFLSHPGLEERPGLTRQSKMMLDRAIRGQGVAAMENINSQFTARIAEVAKANAPITQFCDDLYLKLAPSPNVLRAGFSEAVRRAYVGEVSDLMNMVVNNTRSWASGGVPVPQLAMVRQNVTILIKLMGGPSPKADATPPSRWRNPEMANAGDDTGARIYLTSDVAVSSASSEGAGVRLVAEIGAATFPPICYTSVSYDEKARSLAWKTAPLTFVAKKTIEDLDKYLSDLIANPNNGMKFNEGS